MNKLNISDELFAKYLDGTASEEENEQILKLLVEDPELLEEFTAIAEASKLTDHEPLAISNLEEASRQIKANLPAIQASDTAVSNNRKRHIRLYITAAAAVLAILLASTIYLLLRPTPNDKFLAHQEETVTDTLATTQTQNEILIAENEKPQQHDNMAADEAQQTETETETNTSSASSPANEYHTGFSEEKHYASKAEANSLSMVKPAKTSYAILCKNLDKSFVFEWTATNVQSLHLSIKNSQGKTIAETTDKDALRYELPYRSVYPEKQLSWSLVVNYKDNTQEQRNGQIQIDYNLNNQ